MSTCSSLGSAAPPPLHSTADAKQPAAKEEIYTCKRCRSKFTAPSNQRDSCRFHPDLYTGGEVAKAIGFVRASDAAEHQLGAVVGRTGLMRFWDCCGNEDEAAPGCTTSFHITFDDDLNQAMGWQR
eukprot:CAMPEP_0202911156 /NCGR_PEP_ID=MMETSP1392-20130828/54204_1 /ASSEMBLY_ACC=CAM_ASM_000868 /TAXON_ID=225041 /ORGANISM="Chlamydomonas chlamydogama, Strain SAG 11-48b" /LENGTH=125 /DNA_ID=CAMNT_0049601557 /DNA_START=174 /DNA_END=551 /DNA_ORIENTATION=-